MQDRYASVIHTSLSLQQDKQQTSTQQLPPQEFRMVSVFHPRAEKRNLTNELIGLCRSSIRQPLLQAPVCKGVGLCFCEPPHKVVDFSPLTNQIDPREKQETISQSIYICIAPWTPKRLVYIGGAHIGAGGVDCGKSSSIETQVSTPETKFRLLSGWWDIINLVPLAVFFCGRQRSFFCLCFCWYHLVPSHWTPKRYCSSNF